MLNPLRVKAAIEMNNIRLNDGNSIPQLGYGVWQISNAEASSAVQAAITHGYRSIDTATIYRNEEGVAQGIKNSDIPRSELFITTKVWNEDQGFDETLKAFELSLKKLELDYIDLYLIHWPSPKRNKYVESWKALEKLKAEGLVKSIGVSNFCIEHLERLMNETSTVPALNQIELHPLFQQIELRAFHDKHKIVTEAWSPLGQAKNLDNEKIVALAQKHKKSFAQIILRWHLQSNIVAIPKSVTPSRIKENISLFDFELSSEDMKIMESIHTPNGRIGPNPATADF